MKQSTPKKPANKARMSRKQPPDSRPGRRVEDPKEAYSSEQLTEVGAIILIWNQIETFVDWLIYITIHPPAEFMVWELPRE
jgi:hypothetical protein